MKIATWNIAGGRLSKSLGKFDYSNENINYFVSQINKLASDTVCFQEDHINGDYSIATEIAKKLDYQYIYKSPSSPSHISPDYTLGTTTISKLPFFKTKTLTLPYPDFELFWSDGRPANRWYKNLQIVDFGTFRVANTQLLPLGFWGYRYDEGKGREYCQEIDNIFLSVKDPVIFLGDYSGEFTDFRPGLTMTSLNASDNLDCLDQTIATCPTSDGLIHRNDHIFASKDYFKLIDSKVIKTQTDHYLCIAELQILKP